MIAIRACAALATILLSAPALAGDFYVDPVLGNDANAGTTPWLPWRTIFHASVVLGVSDDTIHLAPGTYSAASGEVFPIQLGGQYLRGDQGAAVTTLLGGPRILEAFWAIPHSVPAVWFREVRGVTLRAASETAVRVRAMPVRIVECAIESSAVGIVAESGSGSDPYDLELDHVTVGSNSGTGLRVSPGPNGSRVVARRCTIQGNTTRGVHLLSGGVDGLDVTLEQCVIRLNGGDGVWLTGFGALPDTVAFDACLVARNLGMGLRLEALGPLNVDVRSTSVAQNGGVGVRLQSQSSGVFALESVISYGNATEYQAALGQFGTVSALNCDIPGAPFVGTNGNIAADPLFRAPLDFDFRLSFGSPCIDAGSLGGFDLGPYPRPIDGDLDTQEVADIGCYEFAPLDLVTTGELGSELQLYLLGPAGGTTTAYASRLGPVPPSTTGFGQFDLNPASYFRLFASGVPVIFSRRIPNNPMLLGRTFSFQALTASAGAPLGAAWTNVASVMITP